MRFESCSKERVIHAIARLWTMTYRGNPMTAAEIAALLNHNLAGSYEEHWVAEEEASAISLSAPNPIMPPTRLDAEIFGESNELFEGALSFAEERTLAMQAGSLCLWSRSDLVARSTALETSGFKQIQTAPTSALDVKAFDTQKFAERVARCPYRIVSINELIAGGVDWIPLLFEATSEMAEDVPDPHDHDPMPYDEYREMVKNPVIYDYDLMFVALDGERIVGYTRVTPSRADPKLVNTGLSGVVRSHRRQGIVTALKVRAVEALCQRGFKRLLTDNDVTNPMYQLNLDLGFVWQWDWLQFQKCFDQQER